MYLICLLLNPQIHNQKKQAYIDKDFADLTFQYVSSFIVRKNYG